MVDRAPSMAQNVGSNPPYRCDQSSRLKTLRIFITQDNKPHDSFNIKTKTAFSDCSYFGAGKGNRTPILSLEG